MRLPANSRATKIILALGLTGLVQGVVLAANSTNATVSVQVINALSITNTRGLDFGQIVESASSQTATIANSDGSNTAVFDVSGNGNSSYDVTLPSSVNIVSASTLTTITINNFSVQGGTSRNLTAGTDSFQVGATANIPANPEAEAYSGNITVSVTY